MPLRRAGRTRSRRARQMRRDRRAWPSPPDLAASGVSRVLGRSAGFTAYDAQWRSNPLILCAGQVAFVCRQVEMAVAAQVEEDHGRRAFFLGLLGQVDDDRDRMRWLR